MEYQAYMEIMLRLVLSCLMGGIIGYERQERHKSAGLRTNILVCLGACLIMILSAGMYASVEGKTNADPARLAAQVVSGIGFLGAGAIMKEGVNVIGLTTAACLWVVAGVGLAVGAGFYWAASLTTLLVFLVCRYMTHIDRWLMPDLDFTLLVTMAERPGQISRISSMLDMLHMRVHSIRMCSTKDDDPANPEIVLEIDLESTKDIERATIVDMLKQIRGVRHVEVS